MKKNALWIVLGIILIIGFALYGAFKSNYNQMVQLSEQVKNQWANVESQYQRRADLIPNLVNTVKGYATHEQETLEGVLEARAKATQMQINFDNMDEETLKRFNQAQGEISSALNRLMAVTENYPNLKANENFRDLQVQLEGTENRIATERRKFNDVVLNYNTFIQLFPRNIFASMFGFMQKGYFQAEEGSEKAPVVAF
ncbi:LemA family protein [Porphyromonadaceae bacterium]